MSNITFTKEIPLNEQYDVIVTGAGPAGCVAAAAAGREGRKVLLVESTGALGGMGTSGLVPAWAPTTDKKQIIYQGFAHKIITQCIEHLPHVPDDEYGWVDIDAEFLKRLYDQLMIDNNVDVLFNTTLCAVNADSGEVSSVVVSNKAGLTAYKAKVYIDCSGDGDLATWAGADFEQGDEEGKLQAATLCFVISNVDTYHFTHGQWLHPHNKNSPIYQILKDGKYPDITDSHLCNNYIGPGVIGFNAGHLWQVDSTKPETVSRAFMQGRKIAHALHQALSEYVPQAFAASHLTATAQSLGIRETRRITCDYCLTGDDLRNLASFDDEIGRNCYYVDIHSSNKENSNSSNEKFRFPDGTSHGIPYRCLTPKGLKNVLIAGRSICTDRQANGSIRVMPTCMVVGEAAGMAAAMVVDGNKSDVREIDTTKLRENLRSKGAYLP